MNYFQVDCLFSLHLFDLVGFYLASSSAAYFSFVSFYLTLFMIFLSTAGSFPLASVVCPFVGEVGPGDCIASWWEG